MLGTTTIKNIVEDANTVTADIQAIVEFNANASFAYDYVGIYKSATGTYTNPETTNVSYSTRYTKKRLWAEDGVNGAREYYPSQADIKYPELFPLPSIFEPIRPGPGIIKMAMTSKRTAGQTYAGTLVPKSTRRIYPCDKNAVFKYWRSGSSSAVSTSTLNVGPYIHYVGEPWVNMITATVQNHAGLPAIYSLQYLNTSNSWVTVWSNASTPGAWPANGRLTVYFQGGSTWSQVPAYADDPSIAGQTKAVKIRGVRLWVQTMNTTEIPLEVIEISPRLLMDFSNRLVSAEAEEQLSEDDSPLPVGSINSNSGRITLSSNDNLLDLENTSSILYGYSPKNAKIMLYSKLWDGAAWELNPMSPPLYSDEWEENEEREVSIRGMDHFKFFQEIDAPQTVWRGKSLSEIVVGLCDWAGFTGVSMVTESGVTQQDPIVPHFVIEKKTKIYDVLRDLAEASQCGMTMARDGTLKIFTFQRLLSSNVAPSFRASAVDDVTGLSNIESFEGSPGKPINDVLVSYTNKWIGKKADEWSQGIPQYKASLYDEVSSVWEGDNITLGAAGVVRTIESTHNVVYIDQDSIPFFGFEGYIVVNDEVMKYRGKQYHMKIIGDANYSFKWIESEAERVYYQSQIVAGTRMYPTGGLNIIVRGAYNTEARDHPVVTVNAQPPGWSLSKQRLGWPGAPWGHASVSTGGAVQLRSIGSTPTGGNRIQRIGNQSMIRVHGISPNDPTFAGTLYRNDMRHNCYTMMTRVGPGYDVSLVPSSGPVVFDNFGTGMRILGRFDSAKPPNPVGSRGLEGVAGLMWDVSADHKYAMLAEIELTTNAGSNNVRLVELINGGHYIRAQASADIQPASANAVAGTMSGKPTNYIEVSIGRKYVPWGGMQTVVYINGEAKIHYTAGVAVPHTGRYGVYVRGNTYADFDYVWGANNFDQMNKYSASATAYRDGVGVLDTIYGGVMPGTWNNKVMPVVFNADAPNTNNTTYTLDEFGPMAREAQYLKVDFTSSPALNAKISNITTQLGRDVIAPIFKATPFGAEVMLMNARRWPVTLGGDKSPVIISGNVIKSEKRNYTLDDYINEAYSAPLDAKIRLSRQINGPSPFEISSDFIQTEQMAKVLTDNIINHMAVDCDIIKMQLFGNPLIEVGDICTVFYAEKGYAGTERFLVTGVRNDFESGYNTELTVRQIG